MHVRPAIADDLGDLQALYSELQPDDPSLPTPDARAAFARILDHPGCTIFVGYAANRHDGDAKHAYLARPPAS